MTEKNKIDATDIKQVIVMRKDLNMRKGKMIAQGAHASLKVILDFLKETDKKEKSSTLNSDWFSETPMGKWANGNFKKVVVYVNSEDELMNIYNYVKLNNISYCSLIEDSGLTEFKGIKTKTCIAIGPDYVGIIDNITGHLPLL